MIQTILINIIIPLFFMGEFWSGKIISIINKIHLSGQNIHSVSNIQVFWTNAFNASFLQKHSVILNVKLKKEYMQFNNIENWVLHLIDIVRWGCIFICGGQCSWMIKFPYGISSWKPGLLHCKEDDSLIGYIFVGMVICWNKG